MRSDPRTDLSAAWAAFKNDGDPVARENLILTYAPLVKYVAGRLSSSLPQTVDTSDLISYGVFGLIDAIEKFDMDRGIKFETYAIARIKGAIIDELRAMDWVPRSVRARAREFEAAYVALENKLKRVPSDDEVAAEMGISPRELQAILAKLSYASVISFEEMWSGGAERDEHQDPLGAIADERAEDPVDVFESAEVKEILQQTARAEVDDGAGGKTQIEAGLGAGALAVDKAVEAVITKKRGGKAVTQAEIDATTGIGLTASSDDGETWTVSAKVTSVKRGGADVVIVAGDGADVSGDTTQRLLDDGSVEWTVKVKQGASPTVHVKRMDTRACWRVKLGSTLAGTYAGTFPVVFPGYGSIEVPYTVIIAPDGTFEGSWHYSGNPGVAGIANYTTDATFGGKLAGTHAEASGTSSAVITGEVGGSMSASNPFTFSADVKQDGSALVGTLVSAGNSIAVNAMRQ